MGQTGFRLGGDLLLPPTLVCLFVRWAEGVAEAEALIISVAARVGRSTHSGISDGTPPVGRW